MKKLLSLLLPLFLALTLTVPALADVIWEPADDFYAMHRDECVYLDGARYEARTEASVVRSPEDPAPAGTIAAGEVVLVEYIWTDGTAEWGSVWSTQHNGGLIEGWVALGDFRKLYGAAEFEADHADEFFEGDGGLPITEEQPVIFWLFPGSGEVVGSVGGPDLRMDEEIAQYGRLWTDADGNDWAEVGYFYGLSGWLYLPDPYTSSLPAAAPRYADESAAPADAEAPAGSVPKSSAERPVVRVGPVITTVVVVLAAATVLLLVLPFKTKDGKGRDGT